jgi:hypothetical protein
VGLAGWSLYDTDFPAWAEQRAEALRGSVERRDLSHALDPAHLAEEIGGVGRRN